MPTSARSPFLRSAALVLTLGAAILAVPGCFLVESQQDCESSCEQLDECGVLAAGNCGTYCAGLVAGATVAGCGDELDAQNDCGKSLSGCDTDATKCAPKVKAFASCMEAYCKSHPGSQGCP